MLYNCNRDDIIKNIEDAGIFCQVGSCSEVYKEIALQQYAPVNELKVTKKLFDEAILLKCDPCISESDAKRTIKKIKEILLNFTLNYFSSNKAN